MLAPQTHKCQKRMWSYGIGTGDERHYVEECPKYEAVRERLREKSVEQFGSEAVEFYLIDVVMYNEKVSNRMRELESIAQRRLDNEIKDYIVDVTMH